MFIFLALGCTETNKENTGEQKLYFPGDIGFIDVSKPPYNADTTGKTDVTAVLQKAIDDHSPYGWNVIYLPAGEYLVSDQLRWGQTHSNTGPVLQGQGRHFTTIRLAESSPGFQDTQNPRGIIWTGDGSADNFKNEIRDLTVIAGRNNPGACGIQFNANNEGTVRNVSIIAEDGNAVTGLDMSYTDMIGPLLVKNVKIKGFNTGIKTAYNVNSMCFEDVWLSGQLECGFVNQGQVVSIRHLYSDNTVPAVKNLGGDMTLVDCDFKSGAPDSVAITNKSHMFARNITVEGYRKSLVSHTTSGDDEEDTRHILEWTSHPVLTLYDDSKLSSLNLEIKETPEAPRDDPSKWLNVEEFGALSNDTIDDSEAIQTAIDHAGDKTTLYFPMTGDDKIYIIDKDIHIRGNIRRIFGGNMFWKGKGKVIFDDGKYPVVFFERFSRRLGGLGPALVHKASRTLVIEDATFSGITGQGTGDLFMNNTVGGPYTFTNPEQHIWCRQFNSEQGRTEGIVNKGSTLWVLGFKTEWDKIKFNTMDGGKTEVLGAFVYALPRPKTTPMFRIENSEASFAGVRQTNYTTPPRFYSEIVQEIRGDTSRILYRDQIYDDAMPLFSGWK